MTHFGDYQNEIYMAGLQGVLPRVPVDFATLESRAAAALPPWVLSYIQGGCGDETTQDSNAQAFRHWGMIPRMMVDCSTARLVDRTVWPQTADAVVHGADRRHRHLHAGWPWRSRRGARRA